MRLGLTIPVEGFPLRDLPSLTRRAEAAGYDGVWSAESTQLDGITPLVVAAQHSERLSLVTGIVNVYTRGPVVLAQTAAALSELSGGRFVLGLGASSNVIVEQWNGIPFERPLARVRTTVESIRTVLAGERGLGGFKLTPPPAHPVPIILAALGQRMLVLAAEIADGAFSNFLPLSGVEQVVRAFGTREKELACRFFSILGDEEQALVTARRIFVGYATVPVYAEFFRWLGWAAEIEPVAEAWQAGDRRHAVDLAPERLIREIFLLGPLEAQRDRLRAFADAGIDTGVLALLGPPEEVWDAIETFGDADR